MNAWVFLLPVFGFLVGIIASLTGVGGGIIIVPILTILFGLIPQHAVGTSLASIVFTALASTYSYSKQKRVFFRTGLLLAITTVPGAYLGAYLTTLISPNTLGVFFGFFLAFVALRMIIGKNAKEEEGMNAGKIERPLLADKEIVKSRRIIVPGVALSIFAGMASGLLGIGGGILGVPIMTLVMGIPIHYATATSMFTMIFTSISGVAKHHLAHHIHYLPALLLAAGTIFGAQVGARLSRRVSGKNLRLIFGFLLLIVGIRMIVKFL